MKRLIVAALLPLACLAESVTVTNEVLTVDQDDNPSVLGVLGTASDVAKLQAQTELNAASAKAAEDTYEQTTNLLADVAAELTAGRTVVYRRYFLDSFTAAVLLDPTVDKVAIYGWEKLPDSGQTVSGRVLWYLYFGCTQDISALTPQVKTVSTLDTKDSEGNLPWAFLDEAYVTGYTPMTGTWTDTDGNTYSNLYRLTVSVPDDDKGFFVVYVNGNATDTTGDTLTIVGGVKGGVTQDVTAGSLTFHVTGGLVTGVENAN